MFCEFCVEKQTEIESFYSRGIAIHYDQTIQSVCHDSWTNQSEPISMNPEQISQAAFVN